MFSKAGWVVCFTGGGGKTTSMLRLAGRLRRHSTIIVTTTTKMAVNEAGPENVLLTKNYPSIYSPAFLSHIKIIIEANKIVFLFQCIENDKYIGLPPEEVSSLRDMNLASWMLVEADGASRMSLKGYAEYEPPLPGNFDCQMVLVGTDALAQPMNELTTARFEILRRFLEVERDSVLTPPLLLRLLTSPEMYLKNSPPDVKRVLCVNKSDLMAPDALEQWVTFLRSELSQYHGILVTGRGGEIFYDLNGTPSFREGAPCVST